MLTGHLEMSDAARRSDRGVVEFDEQALYDAGWRYEDLVAAVDVVATKPGYGIIAECAAHQTALLYTSRGHFIEYEVLVQEMPATCGRSSSRRRPCSRASGCPISRNCSRRTTPSPPTYPGRQWRQS